MRPVDPWKGQRMSAKGVAYTAIVALVVVVAYERYKTGGMTRSPGVRYSN